MSALQVGRLNTAGMHAVGGVPGLYLQVKPPARTWILRATIGEKRRDMGLGGFPAVSLKDARERAREARDQIERGLDPIAVRHEARSALRAAAQAARTFSECTLGFLDAKSDEWRNEKHRQQWRNTLEQYAFPVLGGMLVRDIQLPHVLRVIEPIWRTKTETAKRVRGRIESVLDWATVRGYRSGENPARWRGHLDKMLAKPSKVTRVQHHKAMDIDALPGFIANLQQKPGLGARALEFLILTAARSGEVRGARWIEINMERAEWVVPGERMKAGKEHRVPLSRAALSLLEQLPRVEGTELVFPSTRLKPLSDMTLTKALRDMKIDAVPHGFRSTFKDWCAERTHYANEVSEMCLAHAIDNKVEAAYRRRDLFDKRRNLMEDWARYGTGASGTPKIVRIRSRPEGKAAQSA